VRWASPRRKGTGGRACDPSHLGLCRVRPAHGIDTIGWHCDADNAGSIATALKAGFHKVTEYPTYYVC